MLTKVQSYFVGEPAESRLWVFMSDRPLEEKEVEWVKQQMEQFISHWQAHGQPIKGKFELIDQQFLVVIADENQTQASGCSIDDLTNFVQKMGSQIGVSFTNRMLIAYSQNEEIKTLPLPEFKKAVKNGAIQPSDDVFNNSVSTLSQFWDEWKLPLNESWAKSWL